MYDVTCSFEVWFFFSIILIFRSSFAILSILINRKYSHVRLIKNSSFLSFSGFLVVYIYFWRNTIIDFFKNWRDFLVPGLLSRKKVTRLSGARTFVAVFCYLLWFFVVQIGCKLRFILLIWWRNTSRRSDNQKTMALLMKRRAKLIKARRGCTSHSPLAIRACA